MAESKHDRNRAKCAAYRAAGTRERNKEVRRRRAERRSRDGRRARILRAVDRAHEMVRTVVVELADGTAVIAESMYVAHDGRVLVVVLEDGKPRREVPVDELAFTPARPRQVSAA